MQFNNMNQSLDIKQSQGLSMTPQLQQAIKLLQMTNFELHEFLENQFNTNPLIDVIPSEPNPPKMRADEQQTLSKEEMITKDMENIYENSFSDCKSDISPSLSDLEHKNISNYKNFNGGDSFDADGHYNFSETVDLRQHLSNQLYLSHAPQDIMLIASYLIGSLSDTGYLHESCTEIAGQLMEPVEKVEEALLLCQQLEPAGVFARDLGECLRLQLIDKKIYNRTYEVLLDNLDDLAKNKYMPLLKKLKVPKSELLEMIKQIKNLYPKPGLHYSKDLIIPVIPDVFIQEVSTGGWQVALNHATLPKVMINQTYSIYLKKDHKIEKQTKRYLKQSYHQASWVIKSLEQRSNTILRVAAEILRQQDGFFAYGFDHLRPMNLKQVAEELELHESTISRVTAGKYVRSPRGTFEMKFFFMSGVTGKDGEASVASESVKYDIKKMIDAEDPQKVLSDGDIANLLKQEKDIEIARRTVAKYREAMQIQSSVKRRAEKNKFF